MLTKLFVHIISVIREIVAVIPSVSTASTLPLRGDVKIVRVLSGTYHKVFVQTFNNFSGIFGQIFSFGSDELLLHIKQSQKITHPQNYHFFDVAPFFHDNHKTNDTTEAYYIILYRIITFISWMIMPPFHISTVKF